MIQEIRKKKIGIMGGSFDPIHIGHLILAEYAYEQFHLDEILFIPNGNPPHKKHADSSVSRHRLEMISMAIQDNPHFRLSFIEMEREGISFTFETLELLKKENSNANYFFIMGADSLFDFEHWKEPAKILNSCTILAAARENMNPIKVNKQIEYLTNKYQGQIFRLDSPSIEISSRLLREKIKSGKTIKYFVPEKVEQYIKMYHLYKE